MGGGDGKDLGYVNGNKLMSVEVNGDGEACQFGIPKELFEARLTLEQRRTRYVVASDGKRFLMNMMADEREPARFLVVLTCPALLEH